MTGLGLGGMVTSEVSLARGSIEGIDANRTLVEVQEKLSANVAAIEPQEMEGGEGTRGMGRGRSARHELE